MVLVVFQLGARPQQFPSSFPSTPAASDCSCRGDPMNGSPRMLPIHTEALLRSTHTYIMGRRELGMAKIWFRQSMTTQNTCNKNNNNNNIDELPTENNKKNNIMCNQTLVFLSLESAASVD